jgi:hypothetical protein
MSHFVSKTQHNSGTNLQSSSNPDAMWVLQFCEILGAEVLLDC